MIHIELMLRDYIKNTKAATAIEYGLIAAGIALAISASVFLFGDMVADLLYGDLSDAISVD